MRQHLTRLYQADSGIYIVRVDYIAQACKTILDIQAHLRSSGMRLTIDAIYYSDLNLLLMAGANFFLLLNKYGPHRDS